MNASTRSDIRSAIRRSLHGGEASCLRVVISWSAAGGITAGGLLVGAAALSSPAMAATLLPLAPFLFLAGALGGLAHGSVLAYLGRPDGVAPTTALAAVGTGILFAIPALAVAWVATAWISLTSAVLTLHALPTSIVTALGWALGLTICAWAVFEGWRASRNAFARWTESRPGALLVTGVGVVFAVWFVSYRPELWGTDIRVGGLGAILLAVAVTVWVAAPILVVGLHWVHRRFASTWDAAHLGTHSTH